MSRWGIVKWRPGNKSVMLAVLVLFCLVLWHERRQRSMSFEGTVVSHEITIRRDPDFQRPVEREYWVVVRTTEGKDIRWRVHTDDVRTFVGLERDMLAEGEKLWGTALREWQIGTRVTKPADTKTLQRIGMEGVPLRP